MKLGNVLQEKTRGSYSYDNKKSSNDFSGMIGRKEKEQERDEPKASAEQATIYDYQAMLSEHISYLREKLQRGETQEKFQIGRQAMTIGEWNRL